MVVDARLTQASGTAEIDVYADGDPPSQHPAAESVNHRDQIDQANRLRFKRFACECDAWGLLSCVRPRKNRSGLRA